MATPHPIPPIPDDEDYRLAVLATLDLLDSPPEPEFDALVHVAREALSCPIALVTVVGSDRQWFKARCGIDGTETSRRDAFCAYAVAERELLVVPDALSDPRFAANPFVTGEPHVRFYAGVPLCVRPLDGGPPAVLGTLCVIDTRPREPSDHELQMLRQLAGLAQTLIRARLHMTNAVRYAEEKRADAARIRRQRDQLRRAERIANFGSWRVDLLTDKIEWSDQVFAIHGVPIGETPDIQRALDYYPPRARAAISGALADTMATGKPFDVEVDFTTAAGEARRVRSMGELELGADGSSIGVIGVFQDVTERYAMEQALRRSAHHDALTGIANRAALNAELERRILQARHHGRPLGLMLLDLDGFKPVNDTHGHAAGDQVLQAVAHRLEAPYLKDCFVARLGGDEFVVLLSTPVDCAASDQIGRRLLESIARPIDILEGSVSVGTSIGLAWLEDAMTPSDLLMTADRALYDAKRDGKNCVRTRRTTDHAAA